MKDRNRQADLFSIAKYLENIEVNVMAADTLVRGEELDSAKVCGALVIEFDDDLDDYPEGSHEYARSLLGDLQSFLRKRVAREVGLLGEYVDYIQWLEDQGAIQIDPECMSDAEVDLNDRVAEALRGPFVNENRRTWS